MRLFLWVSNTVILMIFAKVWQMKKKHVFFVFQPMLTVSHNGEKIGYREHDILIVTEDGAENITKYPLGPEHNIIG